ncbi:MULTISPECIES: CGNR zinc finger domain-containing protein [unclassified Pseudofrankia]|uniref:CGNR zinc finger domain-containing protein n=1 Tax=unclassified Pseudofrankia TaxID=2994372 RepID=UPI0009F6DBBA|nr:MULTISPECIES: CGNR zinc finger domain-containing protein [unclassified Pseudofrankia]MDT3444159.1 CGNR zinc finger domain-containing protein [Pseudofrankia sp. BMG5.37]
MRACIRHGSSIDGGAFPACLARSATGRLGGPLAGRVRECGRPDCALLFVDESRAGVRRWCSMDDCGARSKMTAYRARRATGTGDGV